MQLIHLKRNDRLKRQYALITGASSGIGAAFAKLAVAEGCDVGIVARRTERLEVLARYLRAQGARVDIFPADLSKPNAGEALAEQVLQQRKRVDVLINNAGCTITASFVRSTAAEQRAFVELTVTTPVTLVHRLLPRMLEQGWGRIIHVSSLAALSSGGKGNTLYPAGKSFLLKFSQSLNAEVKARGVFSTAVLPGVVTSEFQEANGIPAVGGGTTQRLSSSPELVAREAWRRNRQGHEIVVPGIAPKIAAGLMRILPEPLMRVITRRAAEKYYVGE